MQLALRAIYVPTFKGGKQSEQSLKGLQWAEISFWVNMANGNHPQMAARFQLSEILSFTQIIVSHNFGVYMKKKGQFFHGFFTAAAPRFLPKKGGISEEPRFLFSDDP